jgi:hypothetical protein
LHYQNFKILSITEDELVLYFDEVIPVSIQGFTADMELRHTQYRQNKSVDQRPFEVWSKWI